MPAIVLFSGGRGSATILRAALAVPNSNVTVVINGYDDGLSTGAIRHLVGGFLGPSDFRKTISNVSLGAGPSRQALAHVLETRLGQSELAQLWKTPEIGALTSLRNYVPDLSVKILRDVELFIQGFRSQHQTLDRLFEFASEIALGNLVFAGAFEMYDRDFNKAVRQVNDAFTPELRILNVTDGTNLYLSAIKESGETLWDEASIVGPQDSTQIVDLMLTTLPLRDLARTTFSTEVPDIRRLSALTVTPSPNDEAIEAILNADAIIYGPGTQHSSLFPSYMTGGIGEAIRLSMAQRKILVMNLADDHDIGAENALSLVEKFHSYMSRGGEISIPLNQLASDILVTRDFMDRSSREVMVDFGSQCRATGIRLALGNWSLNQATHHGQYVVQVSLSEFRAKSYTTEATSLREVGVVIPVLNEVKRLPQVLDALRDFDWLDAGLMPRLIAVDGGSTDGSRELLEKSFGLEVLSCSGGVGAALARGANQLQGIVWGTFPADDEYDVSDLARVLQLAHGGASPIVFGSRSGFCSDSRARLKMIYRNRPFEGLLSNYGGILLSILSTVRHRRSVSDPLTSVKAFAPSVAGCLTFSGDGLEWHTRIIREAARGGLPIAEIPVSFRPRGRQDGKKTSVKGGLRALVELTLG